MSEKIKNDSFFLLSFCRQTVFELLIKNNVLLKIIFNLFWSVYSRPTLSPLFFFLDFLSFDFLKIFSNASLHLCPMSILDCICSFENFHFQGKKIENGIINSRRKVTPFPLCVIVPPYLYSQHLAHFLQ